MRDLPISVNDRAISPYAKFRENKTLAKISEFTVLLKRAVILINCVPFYIRSLLKKERICSWTDRDISLKISPLFWEKVDFNIR